MKIKDYIISTAVVILIALGVVFAFANTAQANTPGGTGITNQASATYADVNSNSYSANSNTVTTTVNSVYAVSVNTPTDQSGPSNTVVYYAYTVTNTGNETNTYALAAASGAGGNTWTVTLYADDGAGGGTPNDGVRQAGETNVTSSTGAIVAAATYQFFAAVTIPTGTANGQTDDTDLTVTGSGDAGGGDDTSDTVTTTAQAPALSITKNVRNVTAAGSFATTATADPTDTLEYRMTVNNSGAITATSVVLSDNDNAYTTYTASSIWIGSNATTFNGTGNTNMTDATSGDSVCGVEECGAANATGGDITAYLGNGATESAGGSLDAASTVYVYFRVVVD